MKRIEAAVATCEYEEALELLLKRCKTKQQRQRVVLLKSRLHRAKGLEQIGALDYQAVSEEYQRLGSAILELANAMER